MTTTWELDVTATSLAQTAVRIAADTLRGTTVGEYTDPTYCGTLFSENGQVTVRAEDDLAEVTVANYDERGVQQARVAFGVEMPDDALAERIVAAYRAVA